MKKQVFVALFSLIFCFGRLLAQSEKADTLSLGSGGIIVTHGSPNNEISKLQEWIGGKWRNMEITGGSCNNNLISYNSNSNYGIWNSILAYDDRKDIISETEICTSDAGKYRSDRMFYTYDEQNRFVGQVTQVPKSDPLYWENCIKVIIAYDSGGKLVSSVNQVWGNDCWTNRERDLWVYKGMVIDHGIHQLWDGTKWVPWPEHHHRV